MALNFIEFFQKGKTFKPKKHFQPGTLKHSLHKQAQASLNSGINLRLAVKLPPGEDFNDWLAVHDKFKLIHLISVHRVRFEVYAKVHKDEKQQVYQKGRGFSLDKKLRVVDFFNRINLIYGTVADYCTEESCPTMSGGQKFEYLWADGQRYKKPTPLPAPQYISLLMDWAEEQINNENLFPVKVDTPFPKNFVPTSKKILTRLFRVFVHVYIHHFERLVAIGAEAHVNTCYKHFYYFVTEFNLVGPKELEPLSEMTQKICKDSPLPQQPQTPVRRHPFIS